MVLALEFEEFKESKEFEATSKIIEENEQAKPAKETKWAKFIEAVFVIDSPNAKPSLARSMVASNLN